MRICITENIDAVEYVVLERDILTDKQLTDMYYTRERGVWLRRYPKSALMFPHDFSKIEVTYNTHQRRALTSGFTGAEFEQALGWVVAQLRAHKIRWWLTGSAALFVRGLRLSPHDIDVMTYKTESAKIHDAFGPHIIEPFHHVTGWVTKGFGAIDHSFRIDFGFEPEESVDNGGEVDFGPYAESHLEATAWRNEVILLPPLQTHLLSNRRRNRAQVVRMILDALDRSHQP